MARIVLIRHGDDPDDDRVVSYFRSKGLEPEIRKPFKGERLDDVDGSVIGSVIYGGRFSVFEEENYKFLYDENRWIELCIKQDVPLLGICQGGQSIARVLGAAVGAALLLRRRVGLLLGWALAMAGNGVLNPALKQQFARMRPLHVADGISASGFSFPSGHSSGTVVAFGMLAYLGLRLLPPRWHLPVLLVAVLLAFNVGVSRIILGVHYASDVAAGFASGTAWLAICVTGIELGRWLRHRNTRARRGDQRALAE